MKIETGLQPNHSEYMRLVATFADEKTAQAVHAELVHYLDELFKRADKFSCASFGMFFKTKKEFEAWKKREWNPVVDDRCTLNVEKRGRRCIHVSGSYGLVLDDWSREELAIAFDGAVIALRVYTAGYGMDHVEQWLTKRGGSVQVLVEGEEYEYRALEDAVAEVNAQIGKERPRSVRAKDGHDDTVRPARDRRASEEKDSIREVGRSLRSRAP
jgi:hypothetical protein